MRAFDRCPRCRQRLAGFAVYRCYECGTEFCAGCDLEDRPPAAVCWLAAAALESGLDACPVCRTPLDEDDQAGEIARPV